MLNISILISNQEHPVYTVVKQWAELRKDLNIEIVNNSKTLRTQGDFLFLVSCTEVINIDIRNNFKHCLVLHASNLPQGRGWSPHIWEIIAGAKFITVCLLEAEEKVDTGRIWLKSTIELDGQELFDEINTKLFTAEIELMEQAIVDRDIISPLQQNANIDLVCYPKRLPADSQINPDESIRNQFNLLRVCDEVRFPAFFEIGGQRYTIKLEKLKEPGGGHE